MGMKKKEQMESKQIDSADMQSGSMAQVSEVMKKVEAEVTCVPPDKRLQKVMKILNKKEKKEIIEAVLEKYYNAEELKPYQAELIKVQRHLERTSKKMVVLFDGRDASGKGGTIRRVTRYMSEKKISCSGTGETQ